MQNITHILGILRPVWWLLPETPGVKGYPAEVTLYPYAEFNRIKGNGVFFCPNEMGDIRNEKHNLRHEKNVIRFTSIFIDLDKGTLQEQRERIASFPLPPTLIVQTGRGHHAYWVLDRFEPVDAEAWKRVQKAMAVRLESDPACTDPARLMRLPDTWHVKAAHKWVSIIHCNEQWTYTMADFEEILKPVKKVFNIPSGHAAGKNSGRRIVNQPRAPQPTIIEEGMRHLTLVKESARYLRGVSPSEVDERRATLKAWYAQSARPLKSYWEKEVDDVVDWILKKELGAY